MVNSISKLALAMSPNRKKAAAKEKAIAKMAKMKAKQAAKMAKTKAKQDAKPKTKVLPYGLRHSAPDHDFCTNQFEYKEIQEAN